MISKNIIQQACLASINDKIQTLENALGELAEGIENESKSSAGDKHETSRAMLHNEQEKLSKQLHETQLQKSTLEQSFKNSNTKKIELGSVIKTDKGFIYISIALGKIHVVDSDVFVLSPQSPLGMKLMGLKTGDKASVNGMAYSILEIM